MPIQKLWVVMPVYNEEEAIRIVVDEWMNQLRKLNLNFTLCILNDGSKDNTLQEIKTLQKQYSEILLIDKTNTGHGQSCIMGYREGLRNGADWIFQIDSDGQCDPQYFPEFIRQSEHNLAIFGYRKSRDDGFSRFLISRFVSLFSFAATKVWIKDANVPYRLMHESVLRKALPIIRDDFYLANIYVSILVRKQTRIKWVNIGFRERSGGTPSLKTYSFVKHGIKLFKQLKATGNEKL